MTSTIKVNTVKDTASTDIIKKCGTSITVGTASDTTTVAGNAVRSNAIQASDGQNIISQTGTTITLGASGDTINLASGALQSGFGRTGTVDWITTPKTATFTAVSGEGYFCNTSGGAFTLTLPSSPSVGDIVALKDYAATFGTNNLTIGRGGSNMNGSASDSVRSSTNESLTLVYVDATKGWLAVEEGTGFVGESFITATGGTVTTCGDYKIHTFTGPGNFCVSGLSGNTPLNIIDYLVVAGGGGGGPNSTTAAGGGGGGFRYSATTFTSPACAPAHPLRSPTGLTATIGSFPVTVGAGGAQPQADGSSSVFLTITSAGGGGGTRAGGSGGGGKNASGGSGNTPAVSPPQGNNGGDSAAPHYSSAGGGGAMAVGSDSVDPGPGGDGGPGGAGGGVSNVFGTSGENCGSFYYFSGGGGGGSTGTPTVLTTGGIGGGGDGTPSPAHTATVNTGGGGGGKDHTGGISGNGGSGIVIIRYKYQ